MKFYMLSFIELICDEIIKLSFNEDDMVIEKDNKDQIGISKLLIKSVEQYGNIHIFFCSDKIGNKNVIKEFKKEEKYSKYCFTAG